MTASTAATPVHRLLTEDVIDMAQARREIVSLGSFRPDKTSLYRWATRGVGGIRLESVRIGNRMLTSRQAIHRFIAARSAPAEAATA